MVITTPCIEVQAVKAFEVLKIVLCCKLHYKLQQTTHLGEFLKHRDVVGFVLHTTTVGVYAIKSVVHIGQSLLVIP